MKAKDILKDLVAFNTVKDLQNHEIMNYIEELLARQGFRIERLQNPNTGKQVLIAKFGDSPAIGFLGHTDTVDYAPGWETDPFMLTEKEGMLYGLGACDMKGGIAAFLSAICNTDLSSLKKGINVYCTYDEEILFEGIRDLMDTDPVFPDHIVIAEPTNNIPMMASKGLLELNLTFHGTTTHSSTPIDGRSSNKNAVLFMKRMMEFEDELRKHRSEEFQVPYPTMNLGVIHGGTAINKVPNETRIEMDFRICDTEYEYPRIRKAIDDAIAEFDAEYVIINDIPSFRNHGPLVEVYEKKTGKNSMPFFGVTEGSFLSGDRIILGPGPDTAHQINEHVSLESLADTERVFYEMIEMLCK